MKAIDLTRRRFGRLLVIWESSSVRLPSDTVRRRWLCRCDCGNLTEVMGISLLGGDSRSCGCLRDELSAERAQARTAGVSEWSPLTSSVLNSVRQREEQWERWLHDESPIWQPETTEA